MEGPGRTNDGGQNGVGGSGVSPQIGQRPALALAMADATDPSGTCIMGPSFFWLGGLPGNAHVFAAIPHAVACFSTRRHAQRPIRRRQAQADVFGGREGYRKASNWCPRACNDADDAHWKASKGGSRARARPRERNDAGGTCARMLMTLATAGRAGGSGKGWEGARAGARPPPPCPPPNE